MCPNEIGKKTFKNKSFIIPIVNETRTQNFQNYRKVTISKPTLLSEKKLNCVKA